MGAMRRAVNGAGAPLATAECDPTDPTTRAAMADVLRACRPYAGPAGYFRIAMMQCHRT